MCPFPRAACSGSQLKLQLTVVGRLRWAGIEVVARSLAHKLHEIQHLWKMTRSGHECEIRCEKELGGLGRLSTIQD